MRELTSGMLTEVPAPHVRPAFLLDAEFESGVVHIWTGLSDKDWNGNTYIGAGNLAGISPIGETDDLRSEGVTLTLSGIPSSLLAVALGEVRQGLPATIYLALVKDDGEFAADPYASFSGRIDVPSIEEGAEISMIQLTVESHLVALQRPRIRRYTDADQQNEYAGDLGFEFAASNTAQLPGSTRLPVRPGPVG